MYTCPMHPEVQQSEPGKCPQCGMNLVMANQTEAGPPGILKGVAAGVFVIGGGYYLWTQHRAHVFQYLPLAVFLLCPLMHVFGGHGRHGGHSSE